MKEKINEKEQERKREGGEERDRMDLIQGINKN